MGNPTLTTTPSRPNSLRAGEVACAHCQTPCEAGQWATGEKSFCCAGCRTVFELLTENGLGSFYALADRAGVRIDSDPAGERYEFLDQPRVRERIVDFSDASTTRVTFRAPTIHCVACVWLLENLYRLHPGIGVARVDFARREVQVEFRTGEVPLSAVAALLASLGYPPELNLSNVDGSSAPMPTQHRLWLQMGIAGFAFGNTMLFSLGSYFGLDSASGPAFQRLFGWLSLLLAIPVVIYSAGDYWRSAWTALRQRVLTIEVPIAAGIAAIVLQSLHDVLIRGGEGYFDSLTGLIFFLLCGRWFQQRTYDRLAFDRDYRSFFPISVTRVRDGVSSRVALSDLAVGDRLVILHGELIPADARLISDGTQIDYSFVTGESELVSKSAGEYLYAGGRQSGAAIEVELIKGVSQSYLTSLWSQDAFTKSKEASLDSVTNHYSRHFTKAVLAVAIVAASVWIAGGETSRGVKAFASVLIVACPCALALAAPFALGTALRVFARREGFVKNSHVIEAMARVDAIALDKTGTLTRPGAATVNWIGAPLTRDEQTALFSLCRHSIHPHAVRIAESFAGDCYPEPVRSFLETLGNGMEARVSGREVWMGSEAWLSARGAQPAQPATAAAASAVHVAINGVHRGVFAVTGALRDDAARLLGELSSKYPTTLLSGDNERERGRFERLLHPSADLRFNQSPLDKLQCIRTHQANGHRVLMVGDGLNDSGALKQSDVGVAVVEDVAAFSPASDLILRANRVRELGAWLRFSRRTVGVVKLSLGISAVYNVLGIAIAATGHLSPVICAVLMPVSSVTVVAFAVGATLMMGRKLNSETQPEETRA